ncbi:MAG TPA: hypothetical protein VIW03_17035 [Anaeromyxobacter sp.]
MAKGIIAALAAAAALSGCASIIKGGGPEAFTVRSQPPGADVQITAIPTGETVASGRTPLTAMLPKSRGFFQGAKYKVLVQLPGYQARETILDTNVNGWYVAGNLVFGGLIGWLIVDPATGAMWTLSNEAIDVPLAPAGMPPPTPEKLPASTPTSSIDGAHVGVLALGDVPPALRARMVPVN